MKKFILSIFALAAVTAVSAQKNFVKNGGFEEGIEGWSVYSNMNNVHVVKSNAHSGTASLDMRGGCEQQIQLPQGKYRLTVWANYVRGEEIVLSLREREKGGWTFPVIQRVVMNQQGYNKYVMKFKVKEEKNDYKIMFGCKNNQGQIFIDDVMVEKL
ncbi:MAG: carbohydrate binding domain-containing protein [Rikenellaceae bacterium]